MHSAEAGAMAHGMLPPILGFPNYRPPHGDEGGKEVVDPRPSPPTTCLSNAGNFLDEPTNPSFFEKISYSFDYRQKAFTSSPDFSQMKYIFAKIRKRFPNPMLEG